MFLTHFWVGMRGGLYVLCAEVQKSQNASPVLKVLPPPRGGGGGGGERQWIFAQLWQHNRGNYYSNNLSKKGKNNAMPTSPFPIFFPPFKIRVVNRDPQKTSFFAGSLTKVKNTHVRIVSISGFLYYFWVHLVHPIIPSMQWNR